MAECVTIFFRFCLLFLEKKMAAKLLIACFLLAMVSLATCKPRGMMNPFGKLFQRGKVAKLSSQYK